MGLTNKSKPSLNGFATELTTATFLIVAITGLMLFFHLGPHSLKRVHEWMGVVFVVAALLHIARNFRAFLSLFTRRSLYLALVLVLLVGAGLFFSKESEEAPRRERYRGGAELPQNSSAKPLE